MKIGIIGGDGFIGKHIILTLVQNELLKIVRIDRNDSVDSVKLSKKTKNLDILIISAGVNRAESEDLVYEENIKMVTTILTTLKSHNYKGKIIFLSSIQNIKDNAYGRSKRESEALLQKFASEYGIDLHILVLPNIFGESQKPFYNCVVPTFMHQIVNGEDSSIANAEVELLHVRIVATLIKDIVINLSRKYDLVMKIKGEVINVEMLYKMILNFNILHSTKNFTIPHFTSELHKDLYNTYRYTHWFLKEAVSGEYLSREDDRGYLVELVKANTSGQVFFSTTKCSFLRGGHFHTRKIERFCLLTGHCLVTVKSVFDDFKYTIHCNNKNGTFIDIPNYAIHTMKNVGEDEVIGVFWINEIFNPEDGDVFVKTLN